MNKCIEMGRLSVDVSLDYEALNGTPLATTQLAVDRGYSKDMRAKREQQGKPTADFFLVKAIGAPAVFLSKYSKKGKRVLIEGKLRSGTYDRDGVRHYVTEIMAERVEIIDWASQKKQQAEPDQKVETDPMADFEEFRNDDEIPF
ncbi:single-stranded DNA-binding protein [Gottschalkiaceae bacterium SANA]|nr:single-stranded DNA-binding protein [Gottschalkiaceae bacterium SANA]